MPEAITREHAAELAKQTQRRQRTASGQGTTTGRSRQENHKDRQSRQDKSEQRSRDHRQQRDQSDKQSHHQAAKHEHSRSEGHLPAWAMDDDDPSHEWKWEGNELLVSLVMYVCTCFHVIRIDASREANDSNSRQTPESLGILYSRGFGCYVE